MSENKEQVERFEVEWEGVTYHPKRVWSGHRFTDEEIEELAMGNEITIEAISAKTGKPFKCKGVLAMQIYNDTEFLGFQRTEFVNDGVPGKWCGVEFTDDQKKTLEEGGTIKSTKFVGSSGKAFSAEIKFDKDEGKIAVVQFIKK